MAKLRTIISHISQKLRFGKELYIWGWRWVMFVVWGLPYAGASLYDLLRSEWLPTLRALGEIFPVWLPAAWGIVGLIAFILVTFEGAYRISHQVRKEQNRTTLGIIGGIESDIRTGKKLLEKLRGSRQPDKYLKKEYYSWIDLVGESMQREQYSEFVGWFAATYKQPDVTLTDMVDSCEKGITQLLDTHRRLINSLTSRKGDSQKL